MRVIIDPEVERIVKRTGAALRANDLDEALEMVNQRVLRDDARKLVTATATTGEIVMHLKPFVELALLEVSEIAAAKMDQATKTRKIGEVLSLAGY